MGNGKSPPQVYFQRITTMTTLRIRDLDTANTRTINGIDCVVVPSDCKSGGFTKPLTKVLPTPEEAMQAAIERGSGGDKLIRKIDATAFGYATQGWQVWQRRHKVGGPMRVCKPSGSHAISVNVGSGQWFISEE